MAAITCPAITHMTNAVADSKALVVGTIVKYTCKGDRLFPSGIDTAETQCTGSGGWDPQLEDCQGNTYNEDETRRMPVVLM